jgi:hypothetical protein
MKKQSIEKEAFSENGRGRLLPPICCIGTGTKTTPNALGKAKKIRTKSG